MDPLPTQGTFQSPAEALEALAASLLDVESGGRRLIYRSSRLENFIKGVFAVLPRTDLTRDAEVTLSEPEIRQLAEKAGFERKELRAEMKKFSNAVEHWQFRRATALVAGIKHEVEVFADVSTLPELTISIQVGLTRGAGIDPSFARDQLLEYARRVRQEMESSRPQIGAGVYVQVERVERQQPEPDLEGLDRLRPAPKPAWRSFQEEQTSIAVLGPAGAGKSAILRNEAIRHCERFIFAASEGGPIAHSILPIHLTLTSFAQAAESNSSKEIGRWLLTALNSAGTSVGEAEAVIDQVRIGRVVFLLDGLDEVPWTLRDEAEAVLSTLAESHLPTVFTSRPESYQFSSPRLHALYESVSLPSFSPGEIQEYVRRRFHDRAELARKVVKRAEREHALGNPLLLALYCDAIAASFKSTHHHTRAELYEYVLRGLLSGSWREESHIEKRRRARTVEPKLRLLERIAERMSLLPGSEPMLDEAGLSDFIREATELEAIAVSPRFPTVLDELVERDGVLRKRQRGLKPAFEFLHPTIWSYFVARSLRHASDFSRPLTRSWFDAQWADVLVFLAGMVPDTNRLVGPLLDDVDFFNERLLMAARCLAEVPPDVSAQANDEIIRRSIAALHKTTAPEEKEIVFEALLHLGPRVYPALLDEFREEPSPEIAGLLAKIAKDNQALAAIRAVLCDPNKAILNRLEYAVFATRLGDESLCDCLLPPDKWDSESLDVVAKYDLPTLLATPLAAACSSPAVIKQLVETLELQPRGSTEREVIALTLAKIQDPAASRRAWRMVADPTEDAGIRVDLLYELLFGCGGSPTNASSLFSGKREAILEIVVALGENNSAGILSALHASLDPAVALLGAVLQPEAEPTRQFRLSMLGHEDPEIQLAAVTAFKHLEYTLALQVLDSLASHSDARLRKRAVMLLAAFVPSWAGNIVLRGLVDREREVRRAAYSVAGKLRLAAAVPILLRLVETEQELMGRELDQNDIEALSEIGHALDVLAEIGDLRAVPAVMRRFHEGRISPASLSKFKDDRIVTVLLHQWKDAVRAITWSRFIDFEPGSTDRFHRAKDVAIALGECDHAEVIFALLSQLSGVSPQLRLEILQASKNLLNSKTALRASELLLAQVEIIQARDNRADVLFGRRHITVDYSFGRADGEAEAAYRVLRRAAPVVRRRLSDAAWRIWTSRCQLIKLSSTTTHESTLSEGEPT
jgi:HEAT repeat protein